MNFETIESFLTESVLGMIILGALGSGLYILVVKLIKRTISWGRDSTKERIRNSKRDRRRNAKLLLVSKNYRVRYVISLIRSFYFFVLLTLIITAFFDLSIQMTFGFFTGFTFDVILELSFLKRIYGKLSRREIEGKGYKIPM